MKFLFLSILLSNIVFFFWEYRKGAPEIYLPKNIESQTSNANPQQIFLLSELPAKITPLDLDSTSNSAVIVPSANTDESFIEPKQAQAARDNFVGPLNNIVQPDIRAADENIEFIGPLLANETSADSPEKEQDVLTLKQSGTLPLTAATELVEPSEESELLSACYLLQDGEYSKQMFATTNKSEAFKFALVRQEQQYIGSYLVLTLAANSYQEAKTWEKAIKQQGINELWLFTRGKFKWRISLGLFSTPSNAEKMKASFARRMTRQLEVVPSHQTRMVTEIHISGSETDVASFKNEFSRYFKQQSQCAEVQLSYLPR
ncbi:MAG: hypothetical protein IBX55_03045 [Methyloprofundus sp.]|nr:hypothetical protein [Methyloprofundus sp.]MBW6452536.1 hypothetical protein [Methyloprofundus sp.]